MLGVALWGLAVGSAGAATKITVGYTPAFDVAPAFVAAEEGFFAKHGLDVTLQAGNGSIMISGMVSGSMEIGDPTVTTFLQAVNSGLDLVVVAGGTFMSHEVKQFGVVIRDGVKIEKPQDYVDKTVAVSTIGAFLHTLFVEYLKQNHVDPGKVHFVETPFPQMGDVLKKGSVDAVVGLEPFNSRIVKAGTGHISTDFLKGFPDGMAIVFYAATRSWAEAHRDVVNGFRQAMQEGLDFMKAHPDKMREDTAKFLKLPPDVLAHIEVPDLRNDIEPANLAEWIKIMKSQDLLKGDMDPQKLIFK
jgi:NitT/TauT family transport system substrate-binding protein